MYMCLALHICVYTHILKYKEYLNKGVISSNLSTLYFYNYVAYDIFPKNQTIIEKYPFLYEDTTSIKFQFL